MDYKLIEERLMRANLLSHEELSALVAEPKNIYETVLSLRYEELKEQPLGIDLSDEEMHKYKADRTDIRRTTSMTSTNLYHTLRRLEDILNNPECEPFQNLIRSLVNRRKNSKTFDCLVAATRHKKVAPAAKEVGINKVSAWQALIGGATPGAIEITNLVIDSFLALDCIGPKGFLRIEISSLGILQTFVRDQSDRQGLLIGRSGPKRFWRSLNAVLDTLHPSLSESDQFLDRFTKTLGQGNSIFFDLRSWEDDPPILPDLDFTVYNSILRRELYDFEGFGVYSPKYQTLSKSLKEPAPQDDSTATPDEQ